MFCDSKGLDAAQQVCSICITLWLDSKTYQREVLRESSALQQKALTVVFVVGCLVGRGNSHFDPKTWRKQEIFPQQKVGQHKAKCPSDIVKCHLPPAFMQRSAWDGQCLVPHILQTAPVPVAGKTFMPAPYQSAQTLRDSLLCASSTPQDCPVWEHRN